MIQEARNSLAHLGAEGGFHNEILGSGNYA